MKHVLPHRDDTGEANAPWSLGSFRMRVVAAFSAIASLLLFASSGKTQSPPSAQPSASASARPVRLPLRFNKPGAGTDAQPTPTGTAQPRPGNTAEPAPSVQPAPTGTAPPAPSAQPTATTNPQLPPSNTAQPSPSTTAAPASTPLPSKIEVCIQSAEIMPTKADGTPWDFGGLKMAEKELKAFDAGIQLIVGLIKSAPTTVATEVGKVFGKYALMKLGKPNVFGTAELAPTGNYSSKQAQKLAVASRQRPVEEYRPNFGTTVCFKDVKQTSSLKMRLDLTDKDLSEDDKIATVVLTAKDVAAAYRFEKPYHVYVGDQDTSQLKFVVLSVSSAEGD